LVAWLIGPRVADLQPQLCSIKNKYHWRSRISFRAGAINILYLLCFYFYARLLQRPIEPALRLQNDLSSSRVQRVQNLSRSRFERQARFQITATREREQR
jgi:hypothetical protein